MDWFAVENNGGGDLMEMDLSGSLFGDLNDDVFVDADTLKHFVEPEEATSVNCPPAPAPPVVAAPLENGEFARSNREVQHNCHQATQSLTHDLSRLAWAQKRGAADPQAYAAFRNRLGSVNREMMRVLSGYSELLPSSLAALLQLQELLRMLFVQVDVLENELLRPQQQRCGARLMLLGYSRVAKKDSVMAGLRARVLTGTTEVRAVSAVELFCDEGCPLANATAQVNLQTGEAVFNTACFAAGSAGKVVHLRARLRVASSQAQEDLVSQETVLAVATTTEGQWASGVGRLMSAELFASGSQISWSRFANELQRVYLDGTRQDPISPARPLTPGDFSYINQFKFENRSIVTMEAFEDFWSWFGPALMGLRHSRLLLQLWLEGYVTGFVSKKAAENLLSNCAPETFLLRFSERAAGTFAIAYVKQNKDTGKKSVKHYLLKAGDVAPPQRTIADFLGNQSYFRWLLQTIPQAGPTDTAKWKLVHKDAALERWYGQRGQNLDGYEDELGKE